MVSRGIVMVQQETILIIKLFWLELRYWKPEWMNMVVWIWIFLIGFCFGHIEYWDGAFLSLFLIWLLSCHVCDSGCLLIKACALPVGISYSLICSPSLACSNGHILCEPGCIPGWITRLDILYLLYSTLYSFLQLWK